MVIGDYDGEIEFNIIDDMQFSFVFFIEDSFVVYNIKLSIVKKEMLLIY